MLAIAAIALSVYGIFIIGSAKESVQSHQIQGLVLGVIVMIVISLIRYDLLLRLSWLYYVLAVGLLMMVEIAGESVNNAKRWIVIAGIQFQPSEAAKILIIMFFASFISKREEKLNSARNLLLSLMLIGVPVYLIYDEPDLSTSIVMLVIFAGMFAQITMLSRISGQRKAGRQLEQEIRELSASAENLNLSLNQLASLARVEERARQLGMDKPSESQIRVVTLPGVMESTSTQSAEVIGAEEIQ